MELIRAGQLKKYIKVSQDVLPPERQRSPWRRPMRRDNRERNKDRQPYYRGDRPRTERRHSRSRSRSGNRPIRGRINTISGGFTGGGPSASARKRHVRALQSVNNVQKVKKSMPPINFIDEDFHAPDLEQDDLMVISAENVRYEVIKVLIDKGSSTNILY